MKNLKITSFNKGEHITVTFKSSASSRTKGRIREHGPKFVLFKTIPSFRGSGLLAQRACILVGSLSTGWDGWLPLDEIQIGADDDRA